MDIQAYSKKIEDISVGYSRTYDLGERLIFVAGMAEEVGEIWMALDELSEDYGVTMNEIARYRAREEVGDYLAYLVLAAGILDIDLKNTLLFAEARAIDPPTPIGNDSVKWLVIANGFLAKLIRHYEAGHALGLTERLRFIDAIAAVLCILKQHQLGTIEQVFDENIDKLIDRVKAKEQV